MGCRLPNQLSICLFSIGLTTIFKLNIPLLHAEIILYTQQNKHTGNQVKVTRKTKKSSKKSKRNDNLVVNKLLT